MNLSKSIIVAALILSASLILIAVVESYASPYNSCKRDIREMLGEDLLNVNRVCAGSG